MGLGQRVGEFLIRHTGQDEVDIHAALGGETESQLHFAVQNQIRRHDVDVPSGPVEQVDVDHLAHPFPVQRAVSVGGHKALDVLQLRDRLVEELLQLRRTEDAPLLQKQRRQRADALAFQHHGGILPAAVFFHMIDVLIGQIHPAGKAHPPVDDKDLPVVAVVVMG